MCIPAHSKASVSTKLRARGAETATVIETML